MVNKWVIAIILILVLVGIGFALSKNLSEKEEIEDNAIFYCESDLDCSPKEACHPKTCVNKEFAQDSSGSICTAVCEPGSLDCGQGYCSCINNKCGAVFK